MALHCKKSWQFGDDFEIILKSLKIYAKISVLKKEKRDIFNNFPETFSTLPQKKKSFSVVLSLALLMKFYFYCCYVFFYDAIEGEKEQKEKINESMRTNNNI